MTFVNQNLISNLTYLKNVNWFRNQHTLKALRQTSEIPVLFKSKHYLILNKPYDMIVYNFNKNTKNMPSLYDYLREKFPFYYDPRLTGGFHVLHRLDTITSGVICIPLNYFSQRIAVQAFQTGNAQKYYLALGITFKISFIFDYYNL
jgi:23S rRNA-/tRNA-specific pseudouridylate synthase